MNDTKAIAENAIEETEKLLGGFKKGDLTILAGRPEMGTTTLAKGIATYLSKKRNIITNIFLANKSEVHSVANVISAANDLFKNKQTSFFVVDRLQLLSEEQSPNKFEKIVSSIKSFAKNTNVHVLLVSRLPKQLEERTEKIPELNDLESYGAIQQFADNVLFLYRWDYYGLSRDIFDNDRTGQTQIIVAKNKNGEIGDVIYNWRE